MPTYILKHNKTGDITEQFMSIAAMEELTITEYTQIIGSPKIVSGVKGAIAMSDSGWNDTLQKIKSGSGRTNTIHTK